MYFPISWVNMSYLQLMITLHMAQKELLETIEVVIFELAHF